MAERERRRVRVGSDAETGVSLMCQHDSGL
jgi:hypothetical protein